MSQNEITSKVQNLRELMRMNDELTAEIETIKDELKAHMDANETDTLTGVDFKITYKSVSSSRFDSTAFKKAEPALAAQYTKTTVSKRFVVQ